MRSETMLESSAREDQLPIYDGMRVDVFDEDKRALFEAKMEVITNRLAVLHRTSEMFWDIPEQEADLPVTVRGFHAERKVGIYLEGGLLPVTHGQTKGWMFRNLRVTGTDQGRTFYRAPLQAKAWIASTVPSVSLAAGQTAPGNQTENTQAPGDNWLACQVTNISTGGVRVRTTVAMEPGEQFQIRFKLRRGKEQPPLPCIVRSALDRDGEHEYGCQFRDDIPETEDIIIKTVIELQIMQQLAEEQGEQSQA